MRGKGLTLMASVMLAVLASAALGAGTFAYFSDTETSTGNTFTSGTFGIKLIPGNSLPFTAWNIMPGWSETQLHGVQNIGSVDGEVYITAENFAEPTGYWAEPPEPESSIEMSAEAFAKILFMKIYADLDGDHLYEEHEIIYDGPVYGMKTQRFGIDSGEYISCKFEAYLPTDLDDPLTVGVNEDDNLYQADGVVFDIVFYGTTEITIG